MTITKLAGSKVQFEVVIPVETFKKAVDDAFEKKNNEVEVPGFRKGHCPRAIYEAKFGVESLYPEAINSAVGETYYNAIVENKIEVCGYPKIDLDESKVNGKDPIHYFVTVSVNPEVTLGQYTGLDIKKEKVSVSAKDVDSEIEGTLKREAELVKKEGTDVKIENGDTVVFDFKGTKDGVAFEGGTAKDYTLEIGSHQFIPGFEEQMVGLKEGETKDLACKFPEDYHQEDLKGKDVIFNVVIHEIKTKKTPELTDEFVKGLKIENVATVADYKKHVKDTLTSQKENQATEKAKSELYMAVVKNAKFDLPEDLVQEEADYSFQQAEQQAKQYGLDVQTLLMYTGGMKVEEYKQTLKEQAKNTLSLKFVLKEIAKKEKLTASKKEIEDKYKEIADQYKLSVDQVKAQVPESGIEEEIATTKAYDFLSEKNPFNEGTAAKAETKVEAKEAPAKKTTTTAKKTTTKKEAE